MLSAVSTVRLSTQGVSLFVWELSCLFKFNILNLYVFVCFLRCLVESSSFPVSYHTKKLINFYLHIISFIHSNFVLFLVVIHPIKIISLLWPMDKYVVIIMIILLINFYWYLFLLLNNNNSDILFTFPYSGCNCKH